MKLNVHSALVVVSTLGLALAASGCANKENAAAQITTPAATPNQPQKSQKKALTQLLADSPATTVELKNTGAHDEISSQGVLYTRAVVKAEILPRGAAIRTSSGDLKWSGITAIIHAASGSNSSVETHFAPTLEGISLSVKNSMILATRHGHNRIAIPFIGSGIFLTRIGVSKEVLAESIMRAALENRSALEVRFVGFDGADTLIFRNVLNALKLETQFAALTDVEAFVVRANITDYAKHGADAIVNAANMEVVFGAGISGEIGIASDAQDEINAEAKASVQNFNANLIKMLNRK